MSKIKNQKSKTIYARAKALRISPQKMNLVLELIRGKKAQEAQRILSLRPQKAAPLILKTLNSALANARENLGMKEEDLWVREARADKGPIMKRWRARAKGRANQILKRTTHLTIGLEKEAS